MRKKKIIAYISQLKHFKMFPCLIDKQIFSYVVINFIFIFAESFGIKN